MAELEEALYSRLTGYGGLSPLVASRVYPVLLPQRPTLPAITYQRISGARESGMTADYEMAHPRIQVDIWAGTEADVRVVATEVRGALQRWAGVEAGVTVLDSFIDSERDLYEADVSVFRTSMDFIIWHREIVIRIAGFRVLSILPLC